MNLYEILGILLIHWFSDFVLQTDKQAKGKSKNWKDLLSYTLNYSFLWMIVGSILKATNILILPSGYLTIFVLITFLAHTVTDYFTSRLNSKLWIEVERYRNLKLTDSNNQDYYEKQIGRYTHNFFVSIGFDQWLHYAQLFITYWYLTK